MEAASNRVDCSHEVSASPVQEERNRTQVAEFVGPGGRRLQEGRKAVQPLKAARLCQKEREALVLKIAGVGKGLANDRTNLKQLFNWALDNRLSHRNSVSSHLTLQMSRAPRRHVRTDRRKRRLHLPVSQFFE